LTKDDIDLLSADHDRMMREEVPMREDRDRLLQAAQGANAAADALQDFIELRDTFN